MSATLLITDDWEVGSCLPWAELFCRSRQFDLDVIFLSMRDGKPETIIYDPASSDAPSPPKIITSIFDHVGQSQHLVPAGESAAPLSGNEDSIDDETLAVRVTEYRHGQFATAALDHIQRRGTKLLIIPRHITSRGLDPEHD